RMRLNMGLPCARRTTAGLIQIKDSVGCKNTVRGLKDRPAYAGARISRPTMSSRSGSRWIVHALLLCGVIWFAGLEYRGLFMPDEGRYADTAREMLDANDWVTPRLNGLKYLEKPPLQYWATAGIFALFGFDEWTARLWPALTGALCIAFTAFAAFRLAPGP